jgi:hypothetical protein
LQDPDTLTLESAARLEGLAAADEPDPADEALLVDEVRTFK